MLIVINNMINVDPLVGRMLIWKMLIIYKIFMGDSSLNTPLVLIGLPGF